MFYTEKLLQMVWIWHLKIHNTGKTSLQLKHVTTTHLHEEALTTEVLNTKLKNKIKKPPTYMNCCYLQVALQIPSQMYLGMFPGSFIYLASNTTYIKL